MLRPVAWGVAILKTVCSAHPRPAVLDGAVMFGVGIAELLLFLALMVVLVWFLSRRK